MGYHKRDKQVPLKESFEFRSLNNLLQGPVEIPWKTVVGGSIVNTKLLCDGAERNSDGSYTAMFTVDSEMPADKYNDAIKKIWSTYGLSGCEENEAPSITDPASYNSLPKTTVTSKGLECEIEKEGTITKLFIGVDKESFTSTA